MKDRYSTIKPEKVGRRDALRYLLVGGALVGLQSLFKVPFVGKVIESEKEAAEDRPMDGDLTLYRINPVKAETQGAEFIQPFENSFLPELRELSEQRQRILANIIKLDDAWTREYYDSDDGWIEPLGMKDYNEVITKMKTVFQDATIDSLANTPSSYPVNHRVSSNDHVHIESYKPEFQKKYEQKVAKINTASYALIGVMIASGVAEYFGVLPGIPTSGGWERLSSGVHEKLLEKIAETGLPAREAVKVMAEAFTEHLKNQGLLDLLQVVVMHQVVKRNNKKDWELEYEGEEAYTRDFVKNAFSHVASLNAVETANELGLPSPQDLKDLGRTFISDQPTVNILGFTGYGITSFDFAAMRNQIAQDVDIYSSDLHKVVIQHENFTKDILIADKLNGFQRDRAASVLQPAEGNFTLLIMALIIQLAIAPGSVLHRTGYEAVVRKLFG